MADEPITPAAPAAVAEAPPPAEAAAPAAESTPEKSESQAFVESLDSDIEDLWAKAEGKAPKSEPPSADPPKTEEAPPAEPVKADAPKDTPTPADDPAEIRRRAYEEAKAKFEADERAKAEAETRVKSEQQYRQQYEAYVGPDTDYQAVNQALRSALAGDTRALEALDVLLPNGQTVSQFKGGEKGLTQEDAANLLTAWDTARRYEDVMGDRKVKRIIDFWNTAITSSDVLAHPDVDMAAVTKHAQPHEQMRALRDSVAERVTKRLTEAHETVVKAKDAEIEKQADRIKSLLGERGNLTSQQQAAAAASVDRPGQPGAMRTDLPDPEAIRRMSSDEFFKSGLNDRLLRSIPGGTTRRAG